MLRPPPRFIPPRGPRKLTSRERALAQWRGRDAVPNKDHRAPRPARDLLPAVLKELRIDKRRAEAEVVKVWNHLVDPIIAAHAQPTGLHKRTLFVAVDSNVWLSEIVQYRREEILDRLQHSFGRYLIARISFRVG